MVKRRPLDLTNASLIEVAYAKTGSMLKAGRVVSFITAWDVVRRQLGRRPTVAEYAAWWKEHERTVWRHLELFRTVFDAQENLWPDDVLEALYSGARSQHVGSSFDASQLALI